LGISKYLLDRNDESQFSEVVVVATGTILLLVSTTLFGGAIFERTNDVYIRVAIASFVALTILIGSGVIAYLRDDAGNGGLRETVSIYSKALVASLLLLIAGFALIFFLLLSA